MRPSAGFTLYHAYKTQTLRQLMHCLGHFKTEELHVGEARTKTPSWNLNTKLCSPFVLWNSCSSSFSTVHWLCIFMTNIYTVSRTKAQWEIKDKINIVLIRLHQLWHARLQTWEGFGPLWLTCFLHGARQPLEPITVSIWCMQPHWDMYFW